MNGEIEYPDSSLEMLAAKHGFRSRTSNESPHQYRISLAMHLSEKDRLLAFEVLYGIDMNKWDAIQQRLSTSPVIFTSRALCLVAVHRE